MSSDLIFFGTYGKETNVIGVNGAYDNGVTEKDKVYPLCSFNNPERDLILKIDGFDYTSRSEVQIDFVIQQSIIVYSFLIQPVIFGGVGKLEFDIPKVIGSEKIDFGVKFNDSVWATLNFAGEFFAFSFENKINMIVNRPAN